MSDIEPALDLSPPARSVRDADNALASQTRALPRCTGRSSFEDLTVDNDQSAARLSPEHAAPPGVARQFVTRQRHALDPRSLPTCVRTGMVRYRNKPHAHEVLKTINQCRAAAASCARGVNWWHQARAYGYERCAGGHMTSRPARTAGAA